MTPNIKYNFKVSIDQFGQPVSSDWQDTSEQVLINTFETAVLSLPKKSHYHMIELGANQAYYSILFKSILGKDITTNIMVEPYEPYVWRAKNQFELNGYEGVYIDKSIGDKCVIHGTSFNKQQTSIDELMQEYKINDLDVLHCDIDGAEHTMLEGAKCTLKNKSVNYVFILTHYNLEWHNEVKRTISQWDYAVVHEEQNNIIGADRLLVIKRNEK